jgi:hypothetical protein
MIKLEKILKSVVSDNKVKIILSETQLKNLITEIRNNTEQYVLDKLEENLRNGKTKKKEGS